MVKLCAEREYMLKEFKAKHQESKDQLTKANKSGRDVVKGANQQNAVVHRHMGVDRA